MKMNKNGFTLVEILAVVIIMGVILTLVGANILSILDKNVEKEKKLLSTILVEAARTYVDIENPNGLENWGDLYCVTLQNLYDFGLIELPVINPETNEAYSTTTCVYALNKGEKQLFYVFDEIPASICGDNFTDTRDDKIYSTVQIGDQCWMAKNLAYINPTNDCTTKIWNDVAPFDACLKNGGSGWDQDEVLYQWGVAMNGSSTEKAQGICPDGWYIPADSDVKALEMNLGMTQVAADGDLWRGTDQGSQLKDDIIWNGTNTSNFKLLPSGRRATSAVLFSLGVEATIWTSSLDGSNAWYRDLATSQSGVRRFSGHRGAGYSIRCLKS